MIQHSRLMATLLLWGVKVIGIFLKFQPALPCHQFQALLTLLMLLHGHPMAITSLCAVHTSLMEPVFKFTNMMAVGGL